MFAITPTSSAGMVVRAALADLCPLGSRVVPQASAGCERASIVIVRTTHAVDGGDKKWSPFRHNGGNISFHQL